MIQIDGSEGEGGGQILRTALGLSIVTGKPFRISQIRARRKTPGLLRQHLTCVEAAAQIGAAELRGASMGSTELEFLPTANKPGHYRFAISSAGSAALVLQSVLPALLQADGPSTLELEGGTHNAMAPPYDFLAGAYAPLLARMGAGLELKLERRGFYPAGGGRFLATIQPTSNWSQLQLEDNPGPHRYRATALLSALEALIAERELKALRARLPALAESECQIRSEASPRGPGNALVLEVAGAELTEVFVGFGQRGVSSEQVANIVGEQARKYLRSGAAVSEYLGDQLMLPMALGAGGCYTVDHLSSHARSNAAVIQRFLPVRIVFESLSGSSRVRIET